MEYWTKVKEFHGVELLRNPETFECRILPIERPQQPQTKSVETPVTPEQMARAESSYRAYKENERKAAMQPQPQPERPKTPEETWRYSPALRAEFGGNLASYLAYCKAAEDGRCKVYGCKS